MEKKGKGKTIAIIILTLIIIGLGGYIVYDKFIAKEETEKTEEKAVEKKEETEDLNAVADELISKLKTYKLENLDLFNQSLDFSVTPTKQQVYAMAQYFWEQSPTGTEYIGMTNMTKENVDNYFKTVYGVTITSYPNIGFDDTSVEGNSHYIFDQSLNRYVYDEKCLAVDLLVANNITSNVVSITKENNNYVLTLSKLFFWGPAYGEGFSTSGSNVSSELPEMNQFMDENGELTNESGATQYFHNNASTYNSKKPQYKYTFTKENGSYYLKKYEVI